MHGKIASLTVLNTVCRSTSILGTSNCMCISAAFPSRNSWRIPLTSAQIGKVSCKLILYFGIFLLQQFATKRKWCFQRVGGWRKCVRTSKGGRRIIQLARQCSYLFHCRHWTSVHLLRANYPQNISIQRHQWRGDQNIHPSWRMDTSTDTWGLTCPWGRKWCIYVSGCVWWRWVLRWPRSGRWLAFQYWWWVGVLRGQQNKLIHAVSNSCLTIRGRRRYKNWRVV